jgi:hypothetical protein
MIKITKDTDIEAGNTIYNPTENVRYQVDAYTYDAETKTEVARLKPKLPIGIQKKAFSLSIEELVKLGYKVDND